MSKDSPRAESVNCVMINQEHEFTFYLKLHLNPKIALKTIFQSGIRSNRAYEDMYRVFCYMTH